MSHQAVVVMQESSNANLAIKILEQKIEEIDRDAEAQKAELRDNIARLRGTFAGESHAAAVERTHHPAVRPGQYQGMSRKSALQAYLNERPGKVLVTKAAADLMAGGAPMGKDSKRYRRYLRVTITQNPKTFVYEEQSDTVSLREQVHQQSKRVVG